MTGERTNASRSMLSHQRPLHRNRPSCARITLAEGEAPKLQRGLAIGSTDPKN